jgi:FkbM family methyltransferase
MITAATLFERLPRPLRRHRLMTAWMRLTREDPLQLVRIRDDSFGYADMSDGFLRLIVIDQGFERDFFGIADRILAGGGTFFDGGANHGLLSFGLAGRHGAAVDFHLFEPNPKLTASIRKTLARYPGMRVSLNQAAISDVEGVVRFHIEEDQTGASHITEEGGGIETPCFTVDGYMERAGIGRVDLLKLDVEGYELSALRGARAALRDRRIGAVYFEYFEKWLVRVAPPTELLGFLDEVGFETCFCRAADFELYGGPTHVLEPSGVPLLPMGSQAPPAMTDLMAVPRERLLPVGATGARAAG